MPEEIFNGGGGVTPGGSNVTLLQYPIAPWGWSTGSALLYSGSTSAAGASTHSTMSYYVQPMYIDHPLQVSKIQMIWSAATNGGTGSATNLDYFGLYKLSSDSLTLISSWMAGKLVSQNSDTQLTFVGVTGSASDSIISFTTAAAGAINFISGIRLGVLAQGASSLIQADQYFAVVANHLKSAGVDVIPQKAAVQNNSVIGYAGQVGLGFPAWAPLNGAFSSTSMTNLANSNQWLMPPVVATSDITATAAAQMLRPPIMFRGI